MTLLLTFEARAEELIWFSMDCNLRNADVIIQAEILDEAGNLKIEKYYKGQLANKETLQIGEFSFEDGERATPGFPKAIGKEVILFISLGIDMEIEPAFLGWTLSVLWLAENQYWGVIQRENPGDYELYPYIKHETELKLKIDNWVLFEGLIERARKIESLGDRVDYLIDLFHWHPFKEDILLRLIQEESVSPKKAKNLVWKIFSHPYLSKSHLFPCGLVDYEMDNYYQLAFQFHKKNAGKQFENDLKDFIGSYKNHINYMDWKPPSEIHEEFILELTKFLNENSTKHWEQEKVEILKIISKNERYYNQQFLVSLRKSLN